MSKILIDNFRQNKDIVWVKLDKTEEIILISL